MSKVIKEVESHFISFYILKTVFKKLLNTLYDNLVEALEKLNSFHFKAPIMILSPRKHSSKCARYSLVLKKGWISSNFVKSCSSAINMETIGHFSSTYFFFTNCILLAFSLPISVPLLISLKFSFPSLSESRHSNKTF